jgi:hypothetical protein
LHGFTAELNNSKSALEGTIASLEKEKADALNEVSALKKLLEEANNKLLKDAAVKILIS